MATFSTVQPSRFFHRTELLRRLQAVSDERKVHERNWVVAAKRITHPLWSLWIIHVVNPSAVQSNPCTVLAKPLRAIFVLLDGVFHLHSISKSNSFSDWRFRAFVLADFHAAVSALAAA